MLEENASKLFMCRAILENIIPAFISFFIGPWSDKFGRKPVLLCTTLGRSNSCSLLNRLSREPSNVIYFLAHRIFFGVLHSHNRIGAVAENGSQPMVLSVGFYTVVAAWRHVWSDNRHFLLYHRCIKPTWSSLQVDNDSMFHRYWHKFTKLIEQYFAPLYSCE